MEIRNIHFFSDDDEEFIELLRQAGLTANCAKTLVFLARKKKATSREIEHGTDLRQPEISIAIKTMTGRGWVGMTEQKTPGPGRKIHMYRMLLPMKKIIAEIEQDNKKMVGETLARVKQIRELL